LIAANRFVYLNVSFILCILCNLLLINLLAWVWILIIQRTFWLLIVSLKVLYLMMFSPWNPLSWHFRTLNSRLEHLSLEINTQSLQIEVERAKRQKMRTSLKQLKQEVSTPCLDIAPLRQEISKINENHNATSYHLEAEITRLSTMSFRCFSRMHQILVLLLSHISMPPNECTDMVQLLNEFTRTLHQFHVIYEASYVLLPH